MHRLTLISLPCFLIFFAFSSFAEDSALRGEIHLFDDMKFQNGFRLSYSDSSHGRKPEAILNWGDDAKQPVWRLCQWGTKYSLANAKCEDVEGDSVYQNLSKKVLIGGAESENRDLVLAINGLVEYGDCPRRAGEAWPHLLVEQDAVEKRPLSELAELRLKVKLRLQSFEDGLKDRFDPGLHAAQFQMFLIVKNVCRESTDFNDFFWFGVPFFDCRRDIPAAYAARDVGKDDATGKFIFTIDGKTVNENPMKNQEWIDVDCDLLPHIKEGLKQAAAKGYLDDASPQHYAAVNTNMGWEIPGTYNASVQVRDFDVLAVLK